MHFWFEICRIQKCIWNSYAMHMKCMWVSHFFLLFPDSNPLLWLQNRSAIRLTCGLKFTWALHFKWAFTHKWVIYQTYLWIEIYLRTPLHVSNHSQMGQLSDLLVNTNLLEHWSGREPQVPITSITITSTNHK